MNVKVATTIISDTSAALFRRFFAQDPNKLALAELVETAALAFKVMQSRCIEHDKDRMKCAFGFHLPEQQAILTKFVSMVTSIKWYSLEGPGPKGRGPTHKSNYLHFPYGAKIAVSSVQELHVDLKVCISLLKMKV